MKNKKIKLKTLFIKMEDEDWDCIINYINELEWRCDIKTPKTKDVIRNLNKLKKARNFKSD
jgi:hypothetical protein